MPKGMSCGVRLMLLYRYTQGEDNPQRSSETRFEAHFGGASRDKHRFGWHTI